MADARGGAETAGLGAFFHAQVPLLHPTILNTVYVDAFQPVHDTILMEKQIYRGGSEDRSYAIAFGIHFQKLHRGSYEDIIISTRLNSAHWHDIHQFMAL